MGTRSVSTIMVLFGSLIIAVNVIGWLIAQGITGSFLTIMPENAIIYTIATIVLSILMIIFGLGAGKKKKMVRID
jgi:purine-cytosine permease-like protein